MLWTYLKINLENSCLSNITNSPCFNPQYNSKIWGTSFERHFLTLSSEENVLLANIAKTPCLTKALLYKQELIGFEGLNDLGFNVGSAAYYLCDLGKVT